GSRQTPAPGEHESVATIVVEDLDPMRAYHVHGLVRGRERNEEQDHENERGNARICLQEAQLAPYAVRCTVVHQLRPGFSVEVDRRGHQASAPAGALARTCSAICTTISAHVQSCHECPFMGRPQVKVASERGFVVDLRNSSNLYTARFR